MITQTAISMENKKLIDSFFDGAISQNKLQKALQLIEDDVGCKQYYADLKLLFMLSIEVLYDKVFDIDDQWQKVLNRALVN